MILWNWWESQEYTFSDDQWFEQIKEKFDFMITSGQIKIKTEKDIEFFLNINGRESLISVAVCNINEEVVEINEFITANFHNYSYADTLFNLLSYNKDSFIDKETYLLRKNDLMYLWYYTLYFVIQFYKNKWYKKLKIIWVIDNAAWFYYKAWKLFEKLWIIKKYNLPKYEDIKLGNYYVVKQKVITLEL